MVIIKFYPQADTTLVHCAFLLNLSSATTVLTRRREGKGEGSQSRGGGVDRPEWTCRSCYSSQKNMAGDLEVGISPGIRSGAFCQSPRGTEWEIIRILDLLFPIPPNTSVLLLAFSINTPSPSTSCSSQKPGNLSGLLFGSHTPKWINPSLFYLSSISFSKPCTYFFSSCCYPESKACYLLNWITAQAHFPACSPPTLSPPCSQRSPEQPQVMSPSSLKPLSNSSICLQNKVQPPKHGSKRIICLLSQLLLSPRWN